ncbi:C40 family peptidase [Herbaspirillum seropedicae]|uniref:C40 family peptidase n=1 Tax=Herbaspirillum seropedicae TaxID=964 RepID=UPI003FCD4984
MKPETEAAIRAHAVAEYPRECCGLVVADHDGDELYFPCRNVAPPSKAGRDRRNDYFVLSKADQGAALDLGEVIAVVHSHPDWPATPTQGDLVACEESALPWHIVRVDGADGEVVAAELVTVHPSGYRAPLLGREFFHGVLDCYALIRDWFLQERGVVLKDFAREDGWWEGETGPDLYLEHFREAGFVPIDISQVREGDCFIMQVRSKRANHAAVYIGNGEILHHLYGRPSQRDVYGGYWAEVTRLVVRYVG